MPIQERVDTARFVLPNQEIKPFNFPFINEGLIDLTPQQVDEIEHNLQADLNYRPGLTATIHVPLVRPETALGNPIQVLQYPLTEADALPKNRAIAKIGQVWIYWQLLNIALRTGKYDFFSFRSFDMLPVYLDDKGQPSVKTKTIESWNGLYKRTPYAKYVPQINYGGDADFVGCLSPKSSISVRVIYGEEVSEVSIPHNEIGITVNAAQKVFETAQHLSLSADNEVSNIIESNCNAFPTFVRRIIDYAQKHESSLRPFSITRAYYLHANHPDDKMFDEVMEHLRQFVNTEFAKNLSTSPTVAAVDKLCESLREMYQQALPHYKVV